MGKLVDLTGKQFGQLTVIKRSDKQVQGRSYWDCRCSCGKEIRADAYALKYGHSKSCGCSRKAREYIDFTGMRFERLTVIKRVESPYKNGHAWLCRCDCGKEIIAQTGGLKDGTYKSCGCYARDMAKKRAKHGDARDSGRVRLYEIWNAMKGRCTRVNTVGYKDYGGRGITVCQEWIDSYISFREWALNNGYADNLTIDRIDVNGNYEPSNCRWATAKQQCRNTRRNFNITYNGITKTLEDWGAEYGIKPNTLRYRIKKHKWSIEKALTTPINEKCRNHRARAV